MRTRGESLFADYLVWRNIDFRYEPILGHAGGPPDFAIAWRGVDCFIDVKDRENVDEGSVFPDPLLVEIPDEFPEVEPPYRWLRSKIEKIRVKFAGLKGNPCGLAVYAATGLNDDLEEPDFMLGAMLGDAEMSSDHNEIYFTRNGKMVDPSGRPRNTTISGLLTIRTLLIGDARRRHSRKTGALDWEFDAAERRIGIIVWDNPFATVRFPADLFTGAFDEHWVRDGNCMRRSFCGDGLSEYYRYLA